MKKIATAKEMAKLNEQLVQKAADWTADVFKARLGRKKFNWKTLKTCKALTLDRFECFTRIYVSQNLDILIRTNTISVAREANYRYFEYKEEMYLDYATYCFQTFELLKYILSEAAILPFSWEGNRGAASPSNGTEAELLSYFRCPLWEGRFLEPHNFGDQNALNEWFARCTDPRTTGERTAAALGIRFDEEWDDVNYTAEESK